MKLNKKGFAFSTMLYGSVALIAAVLYIILNITKESVDTTYYFGEELLEELNGCVEEEIALENCYSSSGSCSPTAYRACIGVSDNDVIDKGIIISEKIKESVVTTGNGLYVDSFDTNGRRYIYVGTGVNNFIEYSGKVWRIVSIEANGSLMLIDPTSMGEFAWDSGLNSYWGSDSSLFEILNNAYLSTISDTSKLSDNDWLAPAIYPSKSATPGVLTLTELVAQEQESELVKNKKVGLLLLSDYIKATTLSSCKNDVLGTTTQNCNSWLTESNIKSWVIDIEAEKSAETGSDGTVSGYAFYFGDGQAQSNKPILDKTDVLHTAYPVVILNRNSIYQSGTGSQSDPYILK